MSTDIGKPRIAELHGFYIALGLIVFFFLMHLFDMLHIVELRVLNVVILVVGIYKAVKTLQGRDPGSFTYFKGMGTGVLTGIIGSLLFGLFVFFYVSFIDTDMMKNIIENEPMGRFLNPYIVSIVIAVEGIASSLLVSFILMNYLNTTKIE